MNVGNEAAAEIKFLMFSSSCNLLMLHFPKAGLTLWLMHSTSWLVVVVQLRVAFDFIRTIMTLTPWAEVSSYGDLGPILRWRAC